MITLSCETSTLLGSVALTENGNTLSYQESQRQGSHSDMLNLLVEKVLQESGKKLTDVDIFISGVGPGSFTGIRISLNAIKTFGYCHKKPVMGGNSLLSLAFATRNVKLPSEFINLPVISMINAYKNMCYVATYRVEKTGFLEVKPPEVVRVQNFESYFNDNASGSAIVCGDGFSTYQKFFPQALLEKIKRVEGVLDDPTAKTLGQLAHFNFLKPGPWNELLPLYLRASEAEENLQGIKYQPLI